MRVALLIALKDLRQRLRDRSAILIAIVVPLALGLIFSAILADVGNGKVRFDYAVVDQDHGRVASAFVDGMLGEVEREGIARLRSAASPDEGRRLADRGTVAAAFILPSGFSDAVTSGRRAEIQVIGNPDASIGVVVARSLAESFSADATSVERAVATVAAARGVTDPATLAALADRAAATANPIAVTDLSATRKELAPKTFFAAGMAVFFLFFTVQFGISSGSEPVIPRRRPRRGHRFTGAYEGHTDGTVAGTTGGSTDVGSSRRLALVGLAPDEPLDGRLLGAGGLGGRIADQARSRTGHRRTRRGGDAQTTLRQRRARRALVPQTTRRTAR